MKKVVIIFVAVAVIAGAIGWVVVRNRSMQGVAVQEPLEQDNHQGKGIIIKNFVFAPASIQAKVGEDVVWTNQDTMPHTVAITGFTPSPTLNQGAAFKHAFDKAGTYSYICGLHPSMKGTIIVVE